MNWHDALRHANSMAGHMQAVISCTDPIDVNSSKLDAVRSFKSLAETMGYDVALRKSPADAPSAGTYRHTDLCCCSECTDARVAKRLDDGGDIEGGR